MNEGNENPNDTSDENVGRIARDGTCRWPSTPFPPWPPAPPPRDDGHDWVSEGCVGVALLSLATTVISLLMLKGK